MNRLDWIVDRARDEGALQRRGEFRRLIRRVDAIKPQVIVEIGTCHGGSLLAWCDCATDDALIISVDLPGGEFGGGYHFYRERELMRFARNEQKLELVRGDSHHTDIFEYVLSVLDGREIDFLFIDGDHTYQGASADFWMYGPLVKPGGLIALHDVVKYPEWPRCQVDRLWRDLRGRFADTTTIRTPGDYDGCGIGVLTRPAEWPRSKADEITDRAIDAGAAQKRAEFVQLVEHIEALRPSVVVEIGTMAGGTLRAWCECAAANALIVSIDLPGGQWGGGYHPHDIARLMDYAGEKQRLELITGNSHDEETFDHLLDVLTRPIDFLFIDGDHSYEGVRADFQKYSELVRPGGWIGFHDILEHTGEPTTQVSMLWAEIRDRYEIREFTVPGDERGYGPWGGIGLIRWPA